MPAMGTGPRSEFTHFPQISATPSGRAYYTGVSGENMQMRYSGVVLLLLLSPADAQSIFKVVPTPNGHHGVSNNALSGAAASSPSDIWAVGQTTIHYDGTQWTAFNAPLIKGDNTSLLTGIVDISPTEAWAVGFINQGLVNPGQIIEQWN